METIMTKSARGELYKIVQECQQRINEGKGTQYDEIMTRVSEYIAAIELKLAQLMYEKELFHTKNLTREEQSRVVTMMLQQEGSWE